jgi:hypothetical protein
MSRKFPVIYELGEKAQMKLKHNPGTRSVRTAVRHSLLAASLLAVAGPSLAADDVAGLDESSSRSAHPQPEPEIAVSRSGRHVRGHPDGRHPEPAGTAAVNPAFGTPISRTNSNFQTSGVGVTVDLRTWASTAR